MEMIWRPTIPIIWAAATARGAPAIKEGKKYPLLFWSRILGSFYARGILSKILCWW